MVAIHVLHPALAVAGAAHIDPQAGITMGGKIGVIALVPRPDHVGLAVGNDLEDGRQSVGSQPWSGSHSRAASRTPSGIRIQM